MSCRLKEKECVLNTKEKGQWGKEERHKLHLEKGTPFYIRIRCHENHFEVSLYKLNFSKKKRKLNEVSSFIQKVFVDGKELCEFRYRSPLHFVTHVVVEGQLTLNSVGWEGNYYVKL